MAVEHDYAEILRAIADGKQIQMRDGHDWKDANDSEVLRLISEDWNIEPRHLRAKPERIKKNVTVSIPTPLMIAPKDGTRVYYASVSNHDMVVSFVWDGHSGQLLALKRGVLHLTEEAAIEHAKVLISLTRPE